MYSVQVSREKAIKLLNKLQFFITNKKCTFCIMYWLVNINSKLKLIAQKKQKFTLHLLGLKILYRLIKIIFAN
jgi:hypothetical protein